MDAAWIDVVEALRKRHGGDVRAYDLDVAARRQRSEPGRTPALERVAGGDAQRTRCPRIGYAREHMQQLRAEKPGCTGEEKVLAGKALGKLAEAGDRLVGIAAQMGVHWRKPSGGHPTRRRLYPGAHLKGSGCRAAILHSLNIRTLVPIISNWAS